MKDYNVIIADAFKADIKTKEDAQAFADKHELPCCIKSELGVEFFEIYLVENAKKLSEFPSYVSPATIRLQLI